MTPQKTPPPPSVTKDSFCFFCKGYFLIDSRAQGMVDWTDPTSRVGPFWKTDEQTNKNNSCKHLYIEEMEESRLELGAKHLLH